VTAQWRYAAILVVAAGVSRLPQLTSPHLLLDGDEAILGLMAKHLAEGREAPIFFYGQAYGLSFSSKPRRGRSRSVWPASATCS
jgi:hypothetical protein